MNGDPLSPESMRQLITDRHGVKPDDVRFLDEGTVVKAEVIFKTIDPKLADKIQSDIQDLTPDNIDVETKVKVLDNVVGKEVKSAVSNLVDQMEQNMKKEAPLQSLNTDQSRGEVIKLGEQVEVTNVDGTKTVGEVIEEIEEPAGEYKLFDSRTLKEYWADEGVDVPEDDTVYGVRLGDGGSGNTYHYPESKISEKVFEDSDEMKRDEVTHVGYKCPNCDTAFSKNDPEAIEGDEGELYCSIKCLNEAIQ